MSFFRKKPVVIEAFKWMHDKAPEWWIEKSGRYNMNIDSGTVYIPTLEGIMSAQKGDMIIKGVNGEFYPCKPDIFEKTYELVA
jgi:hypothetical protein